VYCSKCGTAIPDTATNCTSCGQPIYATPLATPTTSAMVPGATVPASGAPVVGAGYVPAYEIRPVYAGFWLRFVAYVLDAVILGVFAIPILFGVAMLMGVGAVISGLPRHGDPFENGFPPVLGLFISVFTLALIIGTWLYHALLESSEWRATAGKKIVGLQVTDMAGARVSFGRATARHFAKIITGLIPLGIGYILAGFTEKRQAVHDMLASCLVLRKVSLP
jgi:uncharacterized RDD family membrane protein YckC